MKVGDLVRLKNLHPSWGEIALITNINVTKYGLGQISLMSSGCVNGAIPWIKRDTYISEVISESR
jgi:hypothetical protein